MSFHSRNCGLTDASESSAFPHFPPETPTSPAFRTSGVCWPFVAALWAASRDPASIPLPAGGRLHQGREWCSWRPPPCFRHTLHASGVGESLRSCSLLLLLQGRAPTPKQSRKPRFTGVGRSQATSRCTWLSMK